MKDIKYKYWRRLCQKEIENHNIQAGSIWKFYGLRIEHRLGNQYSYKSIFCIKEENESFELRILYWYDQLKSNNGQNYNLLNATGQNELKFRSKNEFEEFVIIIANEFEIKDDLYVNSEFAELAKLNQLNQENIDLTIHKQYQIKPKYFKQKGENGKYSIIRLSKEYGISLVIYSIDLYNPVNDLDFGTQGIIILNQKSKTSFLCILKNYGSSITTDNIEQVTPK